MNILRTLNTLKVADIEWHYIFIKPNITLLK